MKNKLMLLPLIFVLIFGCSKKESIKSESMDEIYKEKGIPVKVKSISPEQFETYVTYNANLTGYKQSFASAMVGGRIDKINVKVGDFVKKDSVIIEFPSDAPSVQFIQAKAAFELAKKTYERMKNLYEAGGISKQKLDQVKTQLDVSKANWNSVKQLLKVKAPISGYITAINVHETDNVESRTILATISQTDKLKARIWASEEEINMIKPNQIAQATWNDKTINGKVIEIDQAMNPKHSAFGVNLLFDNPNNRIKSGVTANIKIFTYSTDNAIVLPRKIILSDDTGYYVYTAQNDKAVKRYVKLGKGEENVEIIQGLNVGDKVITKGYNIVYENAKLNILQ